jgi:hypothetical protein
MGSELGKDWAWDYTMHRRFDLLRYRGKGLRLSWANDGSAQLPDIGDEATFGLFDLASLPGLQYGMMYTIEGQPEYALEVPYP